MPQGRDSPLSPFYPVVPYLGIAYVTTYTRYPRVKGPILTGLSNRPPERRGGNGSVRGEIASTNPCTSPGARVSGSGSFATHEARNSRDKSPVELDPVSGGCSIEPSSPCGATASSVGIKSTEIRWKISRKRSAYR